jgi:hypothetical protein
VIETYLSNGSTVNVCTLDLSKAFDRMNHFALYLQLMKRQVPVNLLCIFELWFSLSISCVKWDSHLSRFFTLTAGVRQGGVLSPILFSIYIDDIVAKVKAVNTGCYISMLCCSIFLYADDIVLLSPSITGLQLLIDTCEKELDNIDMLINVKNLYVFDLVVDSISRVLILSPVMVVQLSGLLIVITLAFNLFQDAHFVVNMMTQSRVFFVHLMQFTARLVVSHRKTSF